MNEVSSRSHMLVMISVNTYDERDGSISCAKLNLVDLAGSERIKDSGVTGDKFKEATHINLSLFNLANIVNQLNKNEKVVNFRDSKLTALLKDSIGGNCLTTMVACVSPSA